MVFSLNGSLFKIATNQYLPYIEFDNITMKIKSGFEGEALKTLSQKLNFTYQIIDCNGTWGSLLPDKNWSGIIGQLHKSWADIGIGDISITEERAETIDFGYPHITSTVTFITTKPKPYLRIFSMIDYFDGYVWLSIILLMLTMIAFIHQFTFVSNKPTFGDLIWITYETLLGQSANVEREIPEFNSYKLLYIFWLMFCLIFSAVYGNSIYSQMVLPPNSQTIDTIHDLYQAKVKGQIIVTFFGETSSFNIITKSKLLVYRTLGIKPIELYYSDEDGINAVIHTNKPKAFITSREYLNYVSNKYPPGAFHIPPYTDETTFYLDLIAFGFRKNFQYITQFSKTILTTKEAGLLNFWIANASSTDKLGVDTSLKEFSLNQFEIYFYFLIFGIVFCCLAFSIEYLIKFVH